jgi:hypothetical protein
LEQTQAPREVASGGDKQVDERPTFDLPAVVEHAEVASEHEREVERANHGHLCGEAAADTTENRGEEQDWRAEHSPQLQPRGEPQQGPAPERPPLAGVEGGQHPHEGNGDLGRVPIAVSVGGHAEHDGRQPGNRLEGDAVRTAPQEPSDDEDDERGERDLDGVGQEAEPADAVANADEDELKRPNLQRGIGEGVGPPRGKERPRGVREVRQVGWVARPERRHEPGGAERDEPGEKP